jgi:signal transduction histidine kinase
MSDKKDNTITNTTLVLGQQSFESPTDFEIAHGLLATEQAKEALHKKPFFAKSIAKAQSIFLEEWHTEGGNIREAAYSLLFGTKVFGEYKGARLKSHPKGKCTDSCGPHHRKDGFVWVDMEQDGYYLRKMIHGEALPEVPCYLAGAYSEMSSVHMEEEGAWRPKLGILFDQLYFNLPCEGGEDFKIRAWDLVQGDDLKVLLDPEKGPEEYELLQFDRMLEWKAEEQAKAKRVAEEQEEAEAKRVAEEQAKARLEKETKERNRLAKELFNSMGLDIMKLEKQLKSISATLISEVETARSFSRETRRYLSRMPNFRDFLGTWWPKNFNENNAYTTEGGRPITAKVATLTKAVKEFAPEEVLAHYDLENLVADLLESEG